MTTNTTGDKAREAVSTAADKTKDVASHLADKAKDTASHLADKAKDAASNVQHKAEDMARNAGDMARTAGRRADDATAAVGRGFESAADTIRAKGPREGMLGTATSGTASALENTGRYLEHEKLSGMAEDVTQMIKRNPIPAILLAAGIGFLIGRTVRS